MIQTYVSIAGSCIALGIVAECIVILIGYMIGFIFRTMAEGGKEDA